MQQPPETPHGPSARERPTQTANPRFRGRFFSREQLADLLARPTPPTPWRVEGFVADGTLTLLAAESGRGKSWVGQALCTGVGDGSAMGDLRCTPGNALYVDAEMGSVMFTNSRLRPTAVASPSFEYLDAGGLNVADPTDREWLTAVVDELSADLVIFDSLRRLTPGKSENESDDMAPVVADLAKLARDTRAAIVLIHHKGDGDKPFRGSTAIRDQADALYLLADTQDSNVLCLTCRGSGCKPPRYSAAPPDVHLSIDPASGGVRAATAPAPSNPPARARENLKSEILAVLPAGTKAAVGRLCDISADHGTFKAAWADLEDAGLIRRNVDRAEWQAVALPTTPAACHPAAEEQS